MYYLKYVFQNPLLIIPIIFCQFSMSALYQLLKQFFELLGWDAISSFLKKSIFYSLRVIDLIILKLSILEDVSAYIMSNSLSCKVISLKTDYITLEAS